MCLLYTATSAWGLGSIGMNKGSTDIGLLQRTVAVCERICIVRGCSRTSNCAGRFEVIQGLRVEGLGVYTSLEA